MENKKSGAGLFYSRLYFFDYIDESQRSGIAAQATSFEGLFFAFLSMTRASSFW